jgi:hypothetical protein
MKKFDVLGKNLSNAEMKNVIGGVMDPGNGCTATYSGCNNDPEYGRVTCDYHIVCSGGASWDSCNTECLPGDGGACA